MHGPVNPAPYFIPVIGLYSATDYSNIYLKGLYNSG
jgi:hypothetical protein